MELVVVKFEIGREIPTDPRYAWDMPKRKPAPKRIPRKRKPRRAMVPRKDESQTMLSVVEKTIGGKLLN